MIVTTDQGNPYGQRGLWGHPPWTDPPFVHDVTFRVPLIVRRPGRVPAQRVVDDLVVPRRPPPHRARPRRDSTASSSPASPGRSLAAALRGDPLDHWRDEVFFEYETARSIRTREHLYTAPARRGPATPSCYDLVADPEQWVERRRRPGTGRRGGRLCTARLRAFFAVHVDPRYDLWNGGTGQVMVSRYRFYKERYGTDWEVTMEVGAAYTGPTDPASGD